MLVSIQSNPLHPGSTWSRPFASYRLAQCEQASSFRAYLTGSLSYIVNMQDLEQVLQIARFNARVLDLSQIVTRDASNDLLDFLVYRNASFQASNPRVPVATVSNQRKAESVLAFGRRTDGNSNQEKFNANQRNSCSYAD